MVRSKHHEFISEMRTRGFAGALILRIRARTNSIQSYKRKKTLVEPYHAINIIMLPNCPTCNDSIASLRSSQSEAYYPSYTDKDGHEHLHDGNSRVLTITCTNGHQTSFIMGHPQCPSGCGWGNTNVYLERVFTELGDKLVARLKSSGFGPCPNS